MTSHRHTFAAIAALMLLASSAHAGQVQNGVWTPSGCGTEPSPVAIDLSSEDAFSKSLDASDDYTSKSKTYLDCMFKEVAADAQAMNGAQKAAQDKRNAAIQKAEADTKVGLDKFGKHKK